MTLTLTCMCNTHPHSYLPQVVGCFTRQAPVSRHIGDLAYFNLLWMVLLPLIICNIMPLEARARTCVVDGAGVGSGSGGGWSELNDPHDPDSTSCAHLVFDLIHMHLLKACVQLGMLTANMVRFLSGNPL